MMFKYTQQFKNFFQAILILGSFYLPLNCLASDLDDKDPLRRPHPERTQGNGELTVGKLIETDKNGTDIMGSLGAREPEIAGKAGHKSHKTNSLKPGEFFSFIRGQQFESAMVFYDPRQAPSSQTFNWDSLTTFMQEMDERFFNLSQSKKSFAAGTLGFLIGCISSTPATGAFVSRVGDSFHIPVGEGLSDSIVAWTMITTTPCFAMNLGKRFYIIANALSGQKAFPTRAKLEKAIRSDGQVDDELRKVESTPCVVETSMAHKAAIGLLILASGLDATVNVGVVALAYLEHFPNVFYGTGWAYFLSWMERYYTTGRAKIDRLFCEYSYDTKVIHQKRLLLLESLKNCQKAIAQSDSFVTELHSKVLEKINKNRLEDAEIGNQEVFALSALFLQSTTTMNYEASNSEDQPDETTELLAANVRLMNFQAQQDVPFSWKKKFLDQLSTFLTGGATVGRAVTMEYVLEQLLIHVLSMPVPAATGIAWAASVFDTLFRAFTEGDTQKEYLQGWLNSFSLKHLGDFQWPRKITGWTSITNGGLFSLAKTVAGISAFNVWSVPIMVQILCLVPAFIQDQAYYGAFFESGKDELITNVATIRQPKAHDHIYVKRAWLLYWSRKIKELLTSHWDSSTIGNLYTIVLKGF